MCLGFLNERVSPAKWECQDESLQIDQEGSLCGKTNHFTNFAVLLDSNAGRGGNGPNSSYNIYNWLTLAFVLFAILVVTICVIAHESTLRYKKHKKKQEFAKVDKKAALLLAQDSTRASYLPTSSP